jgi:hypothetical protein
MIRLPTVAILSLALLVMLPFTARGQEAAPPVYALQQIDQMTAPIALYPDPLIAQILMAATYPLEIVEASRWLQIPQNARLRGEQLAAALEQQPWDPSVKTLASFPQVLAMMNSNLQWTERLGDAFLAQQEEVMDSVQRLRQMAIASGHLGSTSQQTIAYDGGAIVIEPANPQVLYAPTYDPGIVYGAWPYPDYQPYYFPQPPGVAYATAGGIGFVTGVVVIDRFWDWDRWDWQRHRIDLDDRRFEELNRGRPPPVSGAWEHDSSHRHGVPYAASSVRERFQGATDDRERRTFRGYAAPSDNRGLIGNAPAAANMQQPRWQAQHLQQQQAPVENMQQQPQPRERRIQQQEAPVKNVQQQPQWKEQRLQQQQAPVFESFSHGQDAHAQSQRGAFSRSTAPAAPMQSAPPAKGEVPRGDGKHRDDDGQHADKRP